MRRSQYIPPQGCSADGTKEFVCCTCNNIFTLPQGQYEKITCFAPEIFYSCDCVECGEGCECR